MRLAPAWIAAFGVVAACIVWPSAAAAAPTWVTLAAGVPGSATPTDSSEFWFDNPHGPLIAVNQLSGGVTAEATTGSGSSFFGGAGTPVLLNLSNGSAYLAGGSPPAAAKTAGAGGGSPASAAPVAGGTVPSDAALLGVNLAETANGHRALTATVTDSLGNPLGAGSLSVPQDGWWVLGLSPGATTTPDPGPVNPPAGDPIPSGGDKSPDPTPLPPTPLTPGGAAATPEPSTIVLAVIGGAAVRAWRRNRLSIAPV
jgi:hypothetical protein